MTTDDLQSQEPEDAGEELDEFYQNLQDALIQTASQLINQDIYTTALLSTLPVALLATENDGLIQTANKAAQEILGLPVEDIIGRPFVELFEAGSDIGPYLENYLRAQESCRMSLKSVTLASGKEISGNLIFEPFYDEEDELRGYLITIEDQTYVHFLQDAFKRYIPPTVSDMIARDPQKLKLGGEEKVLTVLFSDLMGFTTYSEIYTPQQMIEILNEYFTEMTDQIFSCQGTLKEYVGDEIMAIFGAPVELSDHAILACSAALKMQSRLREIRQLWAQKGRPPLKARVGVNSGLMLVGNLGSRHRFSYGVLGDQVNLGSRLEGLCNVYGTEILIGENTARLTKNAFHLREIDMVRVKGRKQMVRIYELIDHAEVALPEAKIKALEIYARGLAAYRQQDWLDALADFEQVQAFLPDDGPSRTMAKRCLTYQENPPKADWDGVFGQITK